MILTKNIEMQKNHKEYHKITTEQFRFKWMRAIEEVVEHYKEQEQFFEQ